MGVLTTVSMFGANRCKSLRDDRAKEAEAGGRSEAQIARHQQLRLEQARRGQAAHDHVAEMGILGDAHAREGSVIGQGHGADGVFLEEHKGRRHAAAYAHEDIVHDHIAEAGPCSNLFGCALFYARSCRLRISYILFVLGFRSPGVALVILPAIRLEVGYF